MAFGPAGPDKKTISHVGCQRFRARPGNGGLHARQVSAIGKKFHGRRPGTGYQVPDGQDGLIGLPGGQGDDFYFREPITLTAETEEDYWEPTRRRATRRLVTFGV